MLGYGDNTYPRSNREKQNDDFAPDLPSSRDDDDGFGDFQGAVSILSLSLRKL